MTRPIPGIPLEEQPAEVLAVSVTYGEARNQSDIAMCGPLCVALNRAYGSRSYSIAYEDDPNRLRSVILWPWAFSCFNANDPNRDKLLKAWQDDPRAWGACTAVADLVLVGACGDPTGGATHYCTKALWGGPGTQWYQEQEITSGRTVKITELGDHVFARAPGRFL